MPSDVYLPNLFDAPIEYFTIAMQQMVGLVRDLNPGPLAPKARIIPLDQRATASYCLKFTQDRASCHTALHSFLCYPHMTLHQVVPTAGIGAYIPTIFT